MAHIRYELVQLTQGVGASNRVTVDCWRFRLMIFTRAAVFPNINGIPLPVLAPFVTATQIRLDLELGGIFDGNGIPVNVKDVIEIVGPLDTGFMVLEHYEP